MTRSVSLRGIPLTLIAIAGCAADPCPLEVGPADLPTIDVTLLENGVERPVVFGAASPRTTRDQDQTTTRLRFALGLQSDGVADSLFFEVPVDAAAGAPASLTVGAGSSVRLSLGDALVSEATLAGTLELGTLEITCQVDETDGRSACGTRLAAALDLGFQLEGTTYQLTGSIAAEEVVLEACED